MRVAYVTETWPPEVNGVAMSVARTVAHLRDAGHAVLLVRPRQEGEWAIDGRAEWRTAGWRIPMYRDLRIGLARVGSLEARFDGFEADLVHVATPGPLGRAAVAAAQRLGIAVTIDFRTRFDSYASHYGFGFARQLVAAYLRDLCNRGIATFVPCGSVQSDLARQGFERVEVSARGVDAAQYTPARRSAALRAHWGAREDTPVLLYVGRLAAEKNVPLALRAFDAVRAVRPDARMVLVGDGPQRRSLAAHRPGLIYAGTQRGDALAAHYASADVFVFPSLSETFGNVVLEAMASGLGVVAFDRAAAGELIRDRRNGRLVAAGDDDAFIAAVNETVMAAAAVGEAGQGARRARARARVTALANDWAPVLQSFERRLHELAGTVPHFSARDATLA